jgi:hypothetical protein
MTVSRGTASAPIYSGGTVPTHVIPNVPRLAGPVVRPVSGPPIPPPGEDSVLAWLDSDDAIPHQGHWVALDSATGQFLGEADDVRSWRVFRERGALVIFVDHRDPESPVYD